MLEVSEVPLARLPYVEGVLSAVDIAETAASIAAMQEPCGAIPWTPGEHVDIWNHVEGAMAMLVGGQVTAAERAYAWIPTMQRPDGSFPMKIVNGQPDDERGEVNMSAYFAVGLWHHWLVRRDIRFVERYWPSVRAALDWVVSMQEPFGGIRWTPVDDFCLLTGNSSIYHSLRAGVALADLMDDPQPEWELAGGRLGHAVRVHRDLFADKSTFSMDWYYPVLGGAVRGRDAFELIESRWDDFVVPELGIRCVDTNPWVTGAETCELAMALDGLGDHRRARQLFTDMQHLRGERRRVLDRLGLRQQQPRGRGHQRRRRGRAAQRALARRAHDLHRRRGDPRRGRAGGEPSATAARGRASCAARRWRRTSRRSRWSATAPQPPSGSPAAPDVRRSTRIEPTASTSSKAPLARAGR